MARFAFASVIALIALVALSVWRRRLRLSYELWHATHGILAVLVALFALLHAGVPECETWPIVAVRDRSGVNVERLEVLLPLLQDIGAAGLAPDVVQSGPARVKLLTLVPVMPLVLDHRYRVGVEAENTPPISARHLVEFFRG